MPYTPIIRRGASRHVAATAQPLWKRPVPRAERRPAPCAAAGGPLRRGDLGAQVPHPYPDGRSPQGRASANRASGGYGAQGGWAQGGYGAPNGSAAQGRAQAGAGRSGASYNRARAQAGRAQQANHPRVTGTTEYSDYSRYVSQRQKRRRKSPVAIVVTLLLLAGG